VTVMVGLTMVSLAGGLVLGNALNHPGTEAA